MEKRLLLAVGLSLIILLSFNAFIAKYNKVSKVNLETEPAQEMSNLEPQAESKVIKTADISSITLKTKELETHKLKVVISNLGGKIQEVWFKDYNLRFFGSLPLSPEFSSNLPFDFIRSTPKEIVLVHQDASYKITKTFRMASDNIVDFKVQIQGPVSVTDSRFSCFSWDLEAMKKDPEMQKNKLYDELDISLADKVLRTNIGKINQKNSREQRAGVNWIGLRDKYFCTVLNTAPEPVGYFTQGNEDGSAKAGLLFKPTGSQEIQGTLYIGPQEAQKLTTAGAGFEQVIHYGTFDVISRFMLKILGFLHGILPNWGLNILIFSVIIFLFLYPLTMKSMNSMREVQKIQPKVDELKKQYKSDPQRLNKEIMELYREHKVNPFGGCLPLILQIPIFFALYQALLRSTALKGSGFLWIKDLSDPDRLMVFSNSIPVLGNELNVLPILMAIIMFFQQKITMGSNPSADPQQQKFMMIFFPLFFAVIFYHFPSGLALYWTVYSFLSLVSQWRKISASRS